MSVHRSWMAGVALALAAIGTAAPPPAAPSAHLVPRYAVTIVVPPFDRLGPTMIGGINEQGTVAAYTYLDPFGLETVAYTVDGKSYMILAGLHGTVCSITYGINGDGSAFGFCAGGDPSDDARATIWAVEGAVMNLGLLPGHTSSVAWDANSRGDVVGESGMETWLTRPVAWMAGSKVDHGLPKLPSAGPWRVRELETPGFRNGRARAVTESGEIIVGTVWDDLAEDSAGTQGFVWAWDGFWPIGRLTEGTFSRLVGVNAAGEAVGAADDEGVINAIRYHAGGIVAVEPLPGDVHAEFLDINDHRIAVGFSGDRAVVAFDDELLDLNALMVLPVNAAWKLEEAIAINNRGQIAGHGRDPRGLPVAFVLTPVR